MPRAVRLDALAGGAGGSRYVLMKGLARLVGEIHPDIHITVVEGGGISSWLLSTGVLTSNNAIGVLSDGIDRASLGSLPLSLIPTFAVPLWTILHIVSLLQLAGTSDTVSLREASLATPSI